MGGFRKLFRVLTLLIVFVGANLISPAKPPVTSNSAKSSNTPHASSGAPSSAINPRSVDSNTENWQGEAKAHVEKLNKGRINVLLLGIDARAREASRSDSIMLLSLNTKTNQATILSVLRDTYVTIPTSAEVKNRVNTAFAIGGPALSVKTVSNFLQVPIQYYVVADFQGFEKAVDALGGVELDVEKRMDYVDDGIYDIHLKPGRQLLNGSQALGYARFRHDELGDFARVERQRKLLQAILSKAQGIQGFYYLPKIFEAIRPYIKTNLDLATAGGLLYLGCKVQSLNTHTVPNDTDFSIENVNGMAVLIPNLQHVRTAARELLP